MKYIPLNPYVIIKPEEFEEVSQGGVLLPDTGKEKPLMGKVIASESSKVKVDDMVVYKKWSANEYKDVVIIDEKDILAICQNE